MTGRLRQGSLIAVLLILVFAGCAGRQKAIFETKESQVALRNMQSRVFETNDGTLLMRTIISTLQDLGFVIDKADNELGSVSGTKRSGYYLRMTVSARLKSEGSFIVRCNAQYGLQLVEDPEPYQRFFEALSKALFLDAQLIAEEGVVGDVKTEDQRETQAEREHVEKAAPNESFETYKEMIPYGTLPDKVKEILGEPTKTLVFDGGESWHYPDRGITVIIYGGKAISVVQRGE